MPTATVIVQKIDDVNESIRRGAKTVGLQGTDGTFYKLPHAMVGMVTPGGSYNFFYRDSNYNGKMYHIIETVQPAQEQIPFQHPAQQAPQYAPAPYAAPPQQPAPQQTPRYFQQAPQQTVVPQSALAPPPFVPNREEQIFVCGALNAAIHAGQVNVYSDPGADIELIIKRLMGYWRNTLGNPRVAIPPSPPSPPANGQQQQVPQRQSPPRSDDGLDREFNDSIPL